MERPRNFTDHDRELYFENSLVDPCRSQRAFTLCCEPTAPVKGTALICCVFEVGYGGSPTCEIMFNEQGFDGITTEV